MQCKTLTAYALCSLIRQVISRAEQENATYIQGSLIDRLAPRGTLRRVLPQPHILRQFPIECLVVEQFAGPRKRIIAFKVGMSSSLVVQRRPLGCVASRKEWPTVETIYDDLLLSSCSELTVLSMRHRSMTRLSVVARRASCGLTTKTTM